jgi:glycosyltransferase involved in cell wall biosynthesis
VSAARPTSDAGGAGAPGVTVVIPCFNHGRFIAECVASLERQTFPGWRAIVVDDASTDGATPALCDAVRSARVEVLHLPENLGRAPARNVGIRRAETEAILSLDADDALHPEHLARTVPRLLSDPRCGVVYTDYQLFGDATHVMRARPFDEAALYRTQYIFAGSVFRRSAFDRTPGYREEFNIGNEDWDLWLSLVEAGYRGEHVPEPLYRYRRHPEAWTSQDPLARAEKILRSRELLRQLHLPGFERSGELARFDYDTHLAAGAARLAARDLPRARESLRRAIGVRRWAIAPRWLLLRALLAGARSARGVGDAANCRKGTT